MRLRVRIIAKYTPMKSDSGRRSLKIQWLSNANVETLCIYISSLAWLTVKSISRAYFPKMSPKHVPFPM